MTGDLTGVDLDGRPAGPWRSCRRPATRWRSRTDAVERVVDATGVEVSADQPVGDAPVLVTGSLGGDLADRLVGGS